MSASRRRPQFNRGGFINVLFGQSYQLFGVNSFATGDPTNTGTDDRSGDRPLRLCGARLVPAEPQLHLYRAHAPRRGEPDGAPLRAREHRELRPLEREPALRQLRQAGKSRLPGRAAKASSARRRSRSPPTGCCRAAPRYDLDASKFNQTIFGASCIDDCFVIAMNYITDYG